MSNRDLRNRHAFEEKKPSSGSLSPNDESSGRSINRGKKIPKEVEDAQRMLASLSVVPDNARSFPHIQTTKKKRTKKEVQIYYLPAAVAVNDRRSAPEGETEKVSGRAM